MIISSFYGLYGVALAFIFFIVSLSSYSSFGLPYTFPVVPFSLPYLKETLYESDIHDNKKRSPYLTKILESRDNMKKLLIIIFCLLISGCNNYRELNNIAVVSALGIDYKDNMYNVSVLVKDNAKNDENKTSIYTYEGKSLDEAIKKIGLLTSKTLYFIDLDVLVISKNATSKLQNIMDYLSRDNNVGVNFYILCDNNFEDSFKLMQNKDNVYGDYVKGILQDNYNNIVRMKYIPFLQKFLSPYYDVLSQ